MKRPFVTNATYLERPFFVRQVESHLFFGPVSRFFDLAYLVFAVAAGSLVYFLFLTEKSIFQYISSLADKLVFLAVPFVMLGLTRRQQAVLGWISVKVSFTIAALIMATVGSITSFSKNQTDALPNLFLGLIWIPWIEFIPSVTSSQWLVTGSRFILSLPCVYFGIQSGYWHW